MEKFTGDTTVKAYTTRARAIVIQLTPKHHVTFDLIHPVYADETVAQLWMSALAAGIGAGIPAENIDGTIWTVA